MTSCSVNNSLVRIADSRNYGVDLLRTVSILMIIILHVLGFGGVLSSYSGLSAGYAAAWFLEMASYGAVNVFAVISGYVYFGRRTKYSSLIGLYLEMIFYTVITTLIFLLVMPDKVGRQDVVYALIPFKIGGYWYFGAYFCMFPFIPFINRLVEGLNGSSAAKMLFFCFFLFSLLPTLIYQDVGGLGNGYSVSWIIVMYLTGACIRKFDFRPEHRRYLLYFLICVTASLAGKLAVVWISLNVTDIAHYGSLFASYVSPLTVCASVCLFLYFRDLQLNDISKRFVRFFAPMTFGVYLIHMEPLVKNTFISGRFGFLASHSVPVMVGGVLLSAMGIWLTCSLIDRVRIYVFDLLRIPSLCLKAETALRKLFSGLLAHSGMK